MKIFLKYGISLMALFLIFSSIPLLDGYEPSTEGENIIGTGGPEFFSMDMNHQP
jgi:hypothetical protein